MTKSSKQIKKFDAEVGKVLSLMINSIYTNKEIFLSICTQRWHNNNNKKKNATVDN